MITGIHHLTAIASDPQRNVDFYAGFLGLRLVKKTVNFDAPDVYHLYYGDDAGTPGTILTFFPFPDALRGKRGRGEVSAVALAIPPASLGYWVDRLATNGVPFTGPSGRFDEEVVSFEDPDGMVIELVTDPNASGLSGRESGAVPAAHVPRRIAGATFTHAASQATVTLLTRTMGFADSGSDGFRRRFLIGSGPALSRIDSVMQPGIAPGRRSAGSVHHIAWRVVDDGAQTAWQNTLSEAGIHVTPKRDRHYFHSIYFHEPGGVLFEIATDPPGFLVDEEKISLGTTLCLPPWLEPRRRSIREHLPPLGPPRFRALVTPSR